MRGFAFVVHISFVTLIRAKPYSAWEFTYAELKTMGRSWRNPVRMKYKIQSLIALSAQLFPVVKGLLLN